MKITDICESTTSGSVATVAAPMNGGPLKRSAVGKGVYGKEPAGSLFTGRKTSNKFANSKLNEEGGFPGESVTVIYIDDKPVVKYRSPEEADKAIKLLRKRHPEAKVKFQQEVIKEAGMPSPVAKHKQKLSGMSDAELAERLKDKSDDELKKMAERHGYGKMSPHYVSRVNKGKKINENELQETDLIIGPGQGHRLKSGFISRAEDRRDHEVEMARSDLHQAHKNSSKIHRLIKNVSEDDGLEGWVQAKITKAADYLNSVCQYLEGKHLHEMTGGVIAGGSGNFEEATDPIAKRITIKKWGGNDEHSWAVLVDGKPAVTGLSKREIPHHKSLVMKKLQEKPQLTGTNLEEGGVGESYSSGNKSYNATVSHRFANRFGYDSDYQATKYKANKYDPKTGLGGYVAPHVYNTRDESNIMIQLQKNINSNRASPLEFKDGSTLEIGPSAAIAALNRIASMKAAEKHETVKNLALSKNNFISFLNDVDQLEEGMGLKQLAAAAAAIGYMLVPNNVGDGTSGRSSADRAYDTYLSQTPDHLIPRYTTPPKDK